MDQDGSLNRTVLAIYKSADMCFSLNERASSTTGPNHATQLNTWCAAAAGNPRLRTNRSKSPASLGKWLKVACPDACVLLDAELRGAPGAVIPSGQAQMIPATNAEGGKYMGELGLKAIPTAGLPVPD